MTISTTAANTASRRSTERAYSPIESPAASAGIQRRTRPAFRDTSPESLTCSSMRPMVACARRVRRLAGDRLGGHPLRADPLHVPGEAGALEPADHEP